jgi:release factor glutamine methyltransferase
VTLVQDALHRGVLALEAASIDTPRLDAELLLAHVLRTTRTVLFAYPERPLSEAEAASYAAALHRRESREPLPYITGVREFLGLTFRVTPAVLIPRPETENLVETVAERLTAGFGRDYPFRLLDVGTGSGCIAIGLAHLLPRATVVAVEPSPDALAVAQENAACLGVADRLEWLAAPFPEAVADRGEEFHAVVSNPPYIPDAEIAALQPEVRDWEPRSALAGGPDGLELIRDLVRHAPRLIRRPESGGPSSLLAVEVAMGQAERVLELLRADGRYRGVEAVADLAGVLRACLACVRPLEQTDDLEREALRLEMQECARVMGDEIMQIQREFAPLDAEVDRLPWPTPGLTDESHR